MTKYLSLQMFIIHLKDLKNSVTWSGAKEHLDAAIKELEEIDEWEMEE